MLEEHKAELERLQQQSRLHARLMAWALALLVAAAGYFLSR
jgi:hypothetical protein